MLIDQLAEQYATNHSTAVSALLQEVYDYTITHHKEAHMISGPLQGQLLTMMAKMQQPKHILEIGTFTGFSALCLAAGLQENGQLHTIEYRPEDADTAQSFFNRSVYKDKIILHRGDAKTIIPQLNLEWDLIFIDADKTAYSTYYHLLMPHLNNQGIMVADNTLFHGQVLDENIKGKNAKAIDAFNKMVVADPSTEQVMLTVRDGLMLIRKL